MFAADPDALDRGTRAHATLQNTLAAAVSETGLEPRSPKESEPDYDLAWDQDGVGYVAEVKSTTRANEERQLRLGIGQLLRYRQLLLSERNQSVQGVLIVEHEPGDAGWQQLCRDLGLTLVWPAVMREVLFSAGSTH